MQPNLQDHDRVIQIRCAVHQDKECLVEFLRAMLDALESYGGRVLAEAAPLTDCLEATVVENLEQAGHQFMLAIPPQADASPIGMVWGSVMTPEDIFQPLKYLHIHALYVTPEYRRQGIGELLMHAVFDWGRSQGCTEAELHSLAGNPALRLYEAIGFQVFELELHHKL